MGRKQVDIQVWGSLASDTSLGLSGALNLQHIGGGVRYIARAESF